MRLPGAWYVCRKPYRPLAFLLPEITAPMHSAHFSLWQVLVLAVVQGITEFLPISSDGHLVLIAPLLFGDKQAPPMMDLTVALHMGTLGSILLYYRQRIAQLLGQDRRLIPLLVLGTIPVIVLVLVCKRLFADRFEQILQSTLLAGLMLPVTGLALLWSQRRRSGQRDYRQLTWFDTLLIGTAQATAILPGLSRSGATIAAGLGRGMPGASAVTFSFLLAIPALLGAGAYEGFQFFHRHPTLSTAPANLALGACISFAVGLAALASLTRVLEYGQLHWFGWYCIALGALVVAGELSGNGDTNCKACARRAQSVHLAGREQPMLAREWTRGGRPPLD